MRSREAARAPWSSTPSAMTATSMPLSVWRTWYSATFGVLTNDRPDYQRVNGDGSVPERLVGASFDGGVQVRIAVGGAADEAVGELVADQRLGVVVQVGEKHLGRRRAVG